MAGSLALGTFVLTVQARGQTPVAVHVAMREFAFRPATIRLVAGRAVRVVFVNEGQIAHQFGAEYLHRVPVRVAGDALSIETAGLDALRLNPEGTARLEFVPRRRGRYVFACTLEGHREAGMSGVLDVR